MTGTLLIASGAYSGPELEAEMGRLPPAFLPVGNRRLFSRQHAAAAAGHDRVLLSIPEDFAPDAMDLAALTALGVEIVPVPGGLSLGESVVYVLNVTASSTGPVTLLHGDTLIQGLPVPAFDAFSVDEAQQEYAWGHVLAQDGLVREVRPTQPDGDGGEVLSGLFRFEEPALLIKHVTRRNGSFLRGLEGYAKERPVRALRGGVWLDFGHLNTYHHSRRQMTTEREFNRLSPSRRRVEKTGSKPLKIEAEARWFATLPEQLRLFAPAFLGMRKDAAGVSYALEYLHLPTLADLFVFGRLGPRAWGRILDACDEFLRACAAHPAPAAAREAWVGMYGPKTFERLEGFASARGYDLAASARINGVRVPPLARMAELAAAAVPPAGEAAFSLIHGDFCFSNIFYDARAEMVRVIDPRGLDAEGGFSVHGDRRYDLAKLYHSVVGRYDHILAGAARLTREGPLEFRLELPDSGTIQAVEAEFLGRRFSGLAPDDSALAIAVLLFLSMLPLHSDDPQRQDTLLANAMRLFARLDAGGSAALHAA